MDLRLHSRLVALNIAAIAAATLIVGYFFFGGSLRNTFESEIQQQLYRSATLAKAYMRTQTAISDPVDFANNIAGLLGVRVTIIAPDGKVVGDSEVSRENLASVANHSDRPEVIDALRTGRGSAVRSSATIGVPFIYVANKLDDGRILRIAMPMSNLEALISGLRQRLLLSILVCAGMTLVFGYMVYAFVSRPLQRLAEASRSLAVGNLDSDIPVSGDRDLAIVGSALNAMARKLKLKIAELEEDKRRTETIIAAMSAGVVVFDLAARVVVSNEAARRLFEISGGLTGRSPLELLRNPGVEMMIRATLKGEAGPAIEVVTGSGRVLLARAAPVRTAAGSTELAVMAVHDLTEIRRSEKMRKEFVANVSHEFKTPLTAIRGFAETLLSEPASNSGMSQEFLSAIERNSALLQALVDDLLVLAKLESEPPVERESVHIRQIIDELVRLRSQQLQEKHIQVEVECEPAEICVDGARLTRAVSNLLDNAIHYNRDKGSIRITGGPTSKGFELAVSDTGAGIPRGDLPRVFERFYRVEKSRVRSAGGTGLGLAIVKHAVESQGGTVSVSSRLGSGSTFRIVLPD
ncbi:MAG TPA: ATP-binding protein [Terriglobia bacterium]|jgi:two-component system phosphate regulon sensor histidine kinase PhoR